ncbi:MAG: hypothetical protein AB1345_02700 [Chloroflexota bacterium]
MKRNEILGGLLTSIGALMGIIGHFLIFLKWYIPGMQAEAAEPGCEILLKYIHPAIADIGVLAGVVFVISAYGFFTKNKWAFPMAVIGIVLALQGSWFINVPFMAADLPPIYFPLFWPYLLLYFLLMWAVGRLPWKRILVGLIAGMAFVFCLMNGIASLSRIITIGLPIFVLVQRLHWVAMIGWGVVTVGFLLRPAEWMRVLGLTAGVLELVVGIPLAVVTAQQLGRFSLFSLAPISCLILVVLFVWPGLWQRLSETTTEMG